MAKKIIILSVVLIGLSVACLFSGQVPLKPFRGSGMVIDTHAKNNLGQLYQVSRTTESVTSTKPYTMFLDARQAGFTAERAHINIKVKSTDEITIKLWENATVTSSGTVLTAYSRNRELADTPGLDCYYQPTVSTYGTCISTTMTSDYEDISETIKMEWVIPTGNTYLIEMLNDIGSTAVVDMGATVEFFETE